MTKTVEKICGIDYSLSSPAICICTGDFHIDNCKIYFKTNVKKYSGSFLKGQIEGETHAVYN